MIFSTLIYDAKNFYLKNSFAKPKKENETVINSAHNSEGNKLNFLNLRMREIIYVRVIRILFIFHIFCV